METEIKSLILNGRFLEAKQKFSLISQDILKKVLFSIAFDDGSICAYTFLCFLIQKNETLYFHRLAATLLENPFCHLEGAYQTALYHTLRAIELCPEDIDLRETLLFFNDIPHKIINDEEALEIALEILAVNPESENAQRILAQSLIQDKNDDA